VHHRPGTHDTGLKRDIQRGVEQAVILQNLPPLAYRHNLGMSGRVMVTNRPIPAFTYHLIVMNQYRAHRHFTFLPGALGQC